MAGRFAKLRPAQTSPRSVDWVRRENGWKKPLSHADAATYASHTSVRVTSQEIIQEIKINPDEGEDCATKLEYPYPEICGPGLECRLTQENEQENRREICQTSEKIKKKCNAIFLPVDKPCVQAQVAYDLALEDGDFGDDVLAYRPRCTDEGYFDGRQCIEGSLSVMQN